MSAPFSSFIQALTHDLRASRRFQVATVLWIPLIITLGVFIVHFGDRHKADVKYHEWKTTFVAEESVQFPDIVIYSANQAVIGAYCKQGENGYQHREYEGLCPPEISSTDKCIYLGTSRFWSRHVNAWQYTAHCTLYYQGVTGIDNNTDIFVHTPSQWGQMGDWSFWGTPVRPNDIIGVHLEPVRVFPYEVPMFTGWSADVKYWSTQWANDHATTYNTTLHIRIPYPTVQYFWESVPRGSWFLLALWGGGIYFFYFLHCVAFGIAKFFLPDDSQLLRASAPAASGFEPIR